MDFTGAGISLSAKANNNQSDNQTDYLPGNYDGGTLKLMVLEAQAVKQPS